MITYCIIGFVIFILFCALLVSRAERLKRKRDQLFEKLVLPIRRPYYYSELGKLLFSVEPMEHPIGLTYAEEKKEKENEHDKD